MTQEESMVFAIKIETWSATDYSYLDNNQLGWVSDDQEWYLFDDEKKMIQYKKYLKLSPKEQLSRSFSYEEKK